MLVSIGASCFFFNSSVFTTSKNSSLLIIPRLALIFAFVTGSNPSAGFVTTLPSIISVVSKSELNGSSSGANILAENIFFEGQ